PCPARFNMASPMMDRAEFPVHKNSTLYGALSLRSDTAPPFALARLRWRRPATIGSRSLAETAEFRMAIAAVGDQERHESTDALDIRSVDDGPAGSDALHQTRACQNCEMCGQRVVGTADGFRDISR